MLHSLGAGQGSPAFLGSSSFWWKSLGHAGKAAGWQCSWHWCFPPRPDADCKAEASTHGSSFPLRSGQHKAACRFRTPDAHFLRLIWPPLSFTVSFFFLLHLFWPHNDSIYTDLKPRSVVLSYSGNETMRLIHKKKREDPVHLPWASPAPGSNNGWAQI